MTKLTPKQKALLQRERHPYGKGDEEFILLHSEGDDRVARNLAAKGYGYFVDFGSHYSWRTRSGYYNHFVPSERAQ